MPMLYDRLRAQALFLAVLGHEGDAVRTHRQASANAPACRREESRRCRGHAEERVITSERPAPISPKKPTTSPACTSKADVFKRDLQLRCFTPARHRRVLHRHRGGGKMSRISRPTISAIARRCRSLPRRSVHRYPAHHDRLVVRIGRHDVPSIAVNVQRSRPIVYASTVDLDKCVGIAQGDESVRHGALPVHLRRERPASTR